MRSLHTAAAARTAALSKLRPLHMSTPPLTRPRDTSGKSSAVRQGRPLLMPRLSLITLTVWMHRPHHSLVAPVAARKAK